jgi:hypothetical protein
MRTDGIRSLFTMVARTIGAARFIERDLEPKIRRAAQAKLAEFERTVDETHQRLAETYRAGGMSESMISDLERHRRENDQRRVRER